MKPVPVLLALALVMGAPAASAQDQFRLNMPGGGIYIGTVTNGVPDGEGYFKDADGMQYEGEVRMGRRTGVAEGVFPKGDRYQGEWKDGRPDGTGKMIYMLGGAYEGQWKNGERHGKGTMTFAGSGKQAEVRFEDGDRVDIAPDLPAPATTEARFSLSANTPAVGSLIPDRIAHGALPLDRGFDKLTPDQQRFVRSYYPALEVGDDPPYPLHGGKELYSALSKLAGRFRLREEIRLYVAVDADGKVSSVTTMGSLDPELKRAIGEMAGLLKYQPGRCAGQPCPGVVPFNVKLTVD